jgi:hypothetical protein
MLPLICGRERIQDLFSALYRQCNNLAFLSCNCGVTSHGRRRPVPLCLCVVSQNVSTVSLRIQPLIARGPALICGLRERRIRTDCRAGLSAAVHLHNIFLLGHHPYRPEQKTPHWKAFPDHPAHKRWIPNAELDTTFGRQPAIRSLRSAQNSCRSCITVASSSAPARVAS